MFVFLWCRVAKHEGSKILRRNSRFNPELSLKAQFHPWTTKTIVLVLQFSHMENDRFGPQTFTCDSNSSLADSRIPFLPFSYTYVLLAANCQEPVAPSTPHCRCRLHEGRPLQYGVSAKAGSSSLAACCPAKSTTPAPPPVSAGADLRRDRGGGRPWMGCGTLSEGGARLLLHLRGGWPPTLFANSERCVGIWKG
jgi:hypothetical protein